MNIKEEISNIRSSIDSICGLLNLLYIKVDNHYIPNPETDAHIGICLDIIENNLVEIERKIE